MLSAILAASVPVDLTTRVATLWRGLAVGRALLTGHVAISVEFGFVVTGQPSCNVRNPLYLSINPKWAQAPIREFRSLRSSHLHSPKLKPPV
jgi:hypothetical protein